MLILRRVGLGVKEQIQEYKDSYLRCCAYNMKRSRCSLPKYPTQPKEIKLKCKLAALFQQGLISQGHHVGVKFVASM
jgi:hypothetical protein